MKASIEISLYPLSENYKDRIVSFIKRLRIRDDIEVVSNGMSTQLFGDYDVLMDLIKNELRPELEMHRTMAILKIGDGFLKQENIPNEIK